MSPIFFVFERRYSSLFNLHATMFFYCVNCAHIPPVFNESNWKASTMKLSCLCEGLNNWIYTIDPE